MSYVLQGERVSQWKPHVLNSPSYRCSYHSPEGLIHLRTGYAQDA